MSIASEITRLQGAKANLKTAIEAKGVTVGDITLDGYAAKVDNISTGIEPTGNINITTMQQTDVTNYATAQVVDANISPENIKQGVTILGETGTFAGTPIPNDLDGLVDGTITTFTMPTGKTTIRSYLFQNISALRTADLTGAVTIGDYAFSNCPYCVFTLPKTFTSIGQYAFRSAGVNSGQNFDLETTSNCSVGTYAFDNSRLASVKGRYTSIGNYAFQYCNQLTSVEMDNCTSLGNYVFQQTPNITKLHLNINGSINTNACYELLHVNDFYITGNITSLGAYAFSGIGAQRSNPSSSPFVFDLRNSTFNTIPQRAFGAGDPARTMRYITYRFPTTVSTIQDSAFVYSDHCDFYFTSSTPPTLQATTCWNASTNYNIFVPYQNINAYRTATNFTAQAAYIKGYGNNFTQGQTLPEYNSEGYGLTWYSDKACTTVVTTADANTEYYCLATANKVIVSVSITELDCTVAVSDGTSTYVSGDDIRVGTVVTITGTPTISGYIPYIFTVNGTTIQSGDTYTVTDAGIKITAIYWDGEHVPAQRAVITGLGNSDPTSQTYELDPNFPTTFEEVTLDGNVFIKIPTIYRKIDTTSDGQITAITMSDLPLGADSHPYSVFVDPNGNVLPYVLIGKYCSNNTSKMNSVSSSSTNASINNWRTAARANGTGYQQYDWQFQKLFVDLALAIGKKVNFNTGTTITNCLGIYDLDKYIWVDGVAAYSNQWVVATDPSKYVGSPTTSTTGYSAVSYAQPTTGSREIMKLGYDSNNEFFNYPSAVTNNSSWNTYYCDGYYYSSGSHPVDSGVGVARAYCGLWYCGAVGDWSSSYCGRLCYRPLPA